MQLAAQNVDYFEKIGLSQAFDILKTADKMKQLGSVTTFEYLQSIRQAFDLKMAYLTALRMYNEAVLRLTYFK